VITFDELGTHARAEEMADTGVPMRALTPEDDRRMIRLLMKPTLHARLRSFIVVLLLMLVLSVTVWGAVYLLNSARPRGEFTPRPHQHGANDR